MASPLVGAWEMVSDTMNGLIVATETHYCTVASPKNRKPFAGDSPTPEEALEAFTSISALGGTYSHSGGKITFARDTNMSVATENLKMVIEATFEGDTMTARIIEGTPGAEGVEFSFRKVS